MLIIVSELIMKQQLFLKMLGVILMTFFISACSPEDPGVLKGTWQQEGVAPMKITFREDEMEANGVVEQVSYRVDKNAVLVTYKTGMAKGMTMRYEILDENTAQSNLGPLKRLSTP